MYAMLWASERPASWPPTTCDGRSSTRMSSSALTHAWAAMKCAVASCQRSGNTSAHAATATPNTPIAHGPNASSGSAATTVNALRIKRPASTSSARFALRAVGVITSSTAPHSGVPM